MFKPLVLIALTLAGTSAALAENPAPARRVSIQQSPATFEALDRNADQQISRTEAGVARKLSDRFAYADSNADGFLSKSEYSAHVQTKAEDRL